MTDFQLTIEISRQDTEKINQEGFKVTLARGDLSPGQPLLLWTSFAPFQRNEVHWKDVYGLYASPDPVEPYPNVTRITDLSVQVPAEPGVVYPFANGVFGAPGGQVDPDQYAAENKTSRSLTFGLTQAITANGEELAAPPINGIALPVEQQVVFLPLDEVSILLFREVTEGEVTIDTQEGLLLLHFSAEDPELTVHWNGEAFEKGPLP